MPEKSRVAGPARRPGMAGTVRRLLRLILVVVLLVGASQGTTLAAPASWDYVALGDSLATGFGAFKGYVPRYEAHIETDTGVAVTRTNLGQNGWTSSQLLSALRSDPTFRRAIREAEIVTWNIGGNDLRAARNSYKKGTCGGADNQACLRASVATLKTNWTAITAEVLELRSTSDTVVQTMTSRFSIAMSTRPIFTSPRLLMQRAYPTPGCTWPSTGRTAMRTRNPRVI